MLDSNVTSGDVPKGHGTTCPCCLKPIDSLAGNPGKWGARAGDDYYHWECIHRAVDYFVQYTKGTELSPREGEREWNGIKGK